MAKNWHITTRQYLDSTANEAVGAGKYVEMTIKNNPGNALFLKAEDFCIGGAELDSGNDVRVDAFHNDDGDEVTTYYQWNGGNVDLGVDCVTFYDKGTPGYPTNTIGVRVYLESTFIPKEDSTIYVDIDVIDGGVVSDDITRGVYFETTFAYHAKQAFTVNDITRPKIVETVLDNGVSSGTVKVKHEGTKILQHTLANNPVAHFTLKRADNKTFDSTKLYQYDYTAGYPSVTFSNLGAYSRCYNYRVVPLYTGVDVTNWMVGTTSRTNRVLWGFEVFIYYNPALADVSPEADSKLPTAGHAVKINYNIFTPTLKKTNTIDSIKHPKSVSYRGGLVDVIVYGSPGSKYKIGIERKESETSTITAATNSYYNFFSSAFQTGSEQKIRNDKGPLGTVVNQHSATISDSGSTVHRVKIPKITATENYRYDIVLTPDSTSVSTFDDSIPTKPGDASIIQYGFKTLTLTPIVIGTASDYGTLPAGIAIKRPSLVNGTPTREYSRRTRVSCVIPKAVSNSKKLILDKENKYIRSGMYAFLRNQGGGIPHLTKVKNVRGKIVTLTADSTIEAGRSVTFISNSSDVVPFEFTIPPNVKTLSPKNDASGSAISGFDSVVKVKATPVVESKTINVGSGLAKLVKPGMVLSAKNKGTVGTPKVDSITDTTIVLETGGEQTFSTTKQLIFDASETSNPNSNTLHIQSVQSSTSVKIQGYLLISQLDNTATAHVLVDSMVTAT